jgi:hypothetical protein
VIIPCDHKSPLKHVSHDDPDEDYVTVMNNAYVEAFNAIHPKGDIVMDKSELVKEINVPEDDEPAVGLLESVLGAVFGETNARVAAPTLKRNYHYGGGIGG